MKDQVKEEEKDKSVDEQTEQQEATQPTDKEQEDTDNSTEEVSDKNDDQDELAKAKQELGEAKEKYLRLYADFENFRRRTSKEKLEFLKTANEGLMAVLLPVLDDFERAQQSMQGDNANLEAIQEGIDLVYSKMVKALQEKGLKEMEVGKGSEFDLEMHEAITKIPSPEEDLKGKVVDVVEKGYLLEEKVIRFAKVVIGS